VCSGCVAQQDYGKVVGRVGYSKGWTTSWLVKQ
jgi:hypothetical protein